MAMSQQNYSDGSTQSPRFVRDQTQIEVLQETCQSLKHELKLHQSRTEEYARLLLTCTDKLDEESLRRETLEMEVNQHKEALSEKLGEIRDRDQTIETQNCLLSYSWSDSQNMAVAQRQKDKLIELLRNQVQDLLVEEGRQNSQATKKRKLAYDGA